MKPDIRLRSRRPGRFHPAFGLAAVLSVLPATVHAQETAKQADSFVDSIGINIKLNYLDTPYGNVSKVQQVLVDAGIRHVRGGSDIYSDTGKVEVAGLTQLGKAGIKTDAIFAPVYNPNYLSADQLILAQLNQLAPYIECVEGPNETDAGFSFNGKPFPQGTIDYQNVLWATVRNSQYAYLPVIAPSISNPPNSPQIAGMEYVSDYGNTHSYNGSCEPDTTTAYPVLDNFYLPWLAKEMENSTKPTMATETGNWVGTSADWDGYGGQDPSKSQDWRAPITPISQGKYALRTLADYYREGIVRTYLHELVDEHKAGEGYYNVVESHFGILYNDWTPKPAYTGIKNLIAALADPGPAFTPGALTYTLTGTTANIHHVLLQKRDGSFDLILWQAIKSYNNTVDHSTGTDVYNLGDIAVPSVPVTLTFSTSMGQVAVIDPTTSASPVSTSSNVTSVMVNVPDNLLILHITPQAAVESPYPGPNAPVVSLAGSTTLQAENYDNGGPGLGFASDYPSNPSGSTYRNNGGDAVGIGTTADVGGNGYYVGWTAQGQYLNYTVNVQTAGNYTATFQIASGDTNPNDINKFDLETAASATGTFTNLTSSSVVAPHTGGWDTWQSVPVTVALQAGVQTLKFYEETGGYSLDFITLAPAVVTGTEFDDGAGPYGGNLANSAKAVFDGSVTTFYDCKNASTGYVGIDAGAAVPVTQITFSPRPGYESRMVGGVFEGSNTSTITGYTTLATVASTPKDGMVNLLTVTGGKTYRYLRYRGPAKSYCDVAEIKFQN